MTRNDIAQEVARATNLPASTADKAVMAVFQAISQSLMRGESVQIRGFGTFELTERAARTGRIVGRGESVVIPPRSVPTFRPSDSFRDMVNK